MMMMMMLPVLIGQWSRWNNYNEQHFAVLLAVF